MSPSIQQLILYTFLVSLRLKVVCYASVSSRWRGLSEPWCGGSGGGWGGDLLILNATFFLPTVLFAVLDTAAE